MTSPAAPSRGRARLAKSWFFSIAGRGAGFILFLMSVQILDERAFTRFSILYAAMGFVAFVLFTFEQNYRFSRTDGETSDWLLWPGLLGCAISVAIVFFATRSVAIALSMAVIALLQTFLTRRRVELLFAGEQMALYLSPLLRDGVAILGFIFIAASREISGIAVLMAVAVLAEFVALSFIVRKYTNTATREPAEAGNTRNELVRAGVLTMVASVLLAVTPLIMRSLVLRLLGEADFAVYEVADRNAYVLMSVVVGGMSVEALRRWRLAVANGNEASVLRESIVSVWLMVGLVITYSAVIISPVGEFVLKLLLGSEVDIDRIQRLSPIIAASSAAYVGAHLVTRALVALRREPLASAMLAVGAVITIAVSLLGTVVVDSLNVAAFASTVGFGLTIVASLTVATRGAAAEP